LFPSFTNAQVQMQKKIYLFLLQVLNIYVRLSIIHRAYALICAFVPFVLEGWNIKLFK